MEELKIINFIEKYKKIIDENLVNNIISNFKLESKLELKEWEMEGLKLIDETIPYLENIWKNPNRIIENKGDVVKIELAKRITPESIKHLGSHTNLIQSFDKEKDEVQPSKILNIEKVENFLTYENRLIYTLIQNILFFIEKSKKSIEEIEILEINQDKDLKYNATLKDHGEDINISLQISTQMDKETLLKRINAKKKLVGEIETKVFAIMNTEIYETLVNSRVKEVTPPIKKTNLILKNVNFNYTMKLWDYLQENMDKFEKEENMVREENSQNNKALKNMLNELAFVDYMILKKYKEIQSKTEKTEKEKLTLKNMKNQELNRIVLRQIKKGEFKNYMVEQQIKNIFSKYIDEYCEQIKK